MTAEKLAESLGKLNTEAQSLAEDGTPYTASLLVQLRAAAENAANDAKFRADREKQRQAKSDAARKPAPKAQ